MPWRGQKTADWSPRWVLIKARILVASVSPGLKWTRLHEESSLSKLAGVEEMETRGREHWLMLTAFLASVFSY